MQREDEPKPEDELDLKDRLLAAFLAPIAFNLFIFIVMSFAGRRSKLFVEAVLLGHGSLLLLILIPVAAGFVLGTARMATLLGHLFYTNGEREKDIRVTAALWLALFLLVYLWLN